MIGARLSVLASTWGRHGDRWMLEGYHEGVSLREIVQVVSGIDGLEGIELIYPLHLTGESCRDVGRMIGDSGLEISSIANSISGKPAYYRGALTALDPGVRRAAVDTVKRGLDVAEELGVGRTNLWLGREGFDYPFQVDHASCWSLLVESLAECAAHLPSVRICIEYKLREPRCHLLVGTAATALLLIGQIGLPNLGVLLDTGHSLLAYENLAQTVFLTTRAGRLFHVHLNDNHRIGDDDMVAGSVHFFEFLEALHWLGRVGYTGWVSFDPHPLCEDETRSVQESVRFYRGALRLLSRVGAARIDGLLERRAALEVYRELQGELFGADRT